MRFSNVHGAKYIGTSFEMVEATDGPTDRPGSASAHKLTTATNMLLREMVATATRIIYFLLLCTGSSSVEFSWNESRAAPRCSVALHVAPHGRPRVCLRACFFSPIQR